jgi:hypothetical protein
MPLVQIPVEQTCPQAPQFFGSVQRFAVQVGVSGEVVVELVYDIVDLVVVLVRVVVLNMVVYCSCQRDERDARVGRGI